MSLRVVHESKLGERFSRQFAVCSGFSADHLIVNLTSAGKHTGKGNLQPEKIHPLFKTSVFLHNAFYVFVSKGRMSQHSCQARQASSPHRLLETGAHEERKEEEAFLSFQSALYISSLLRVFSSRALWKPTKQNLNGACHAWLRAVILRRRNCCCRATSFTSFYLLDSLFISDNNETAVFYYLVNSVLILWQYPKILLYFETKMCFKRTDRQAHNFYAVCCIQQSQFFKLASVNIPTLSPFKDIRLPRNRDFSFFMVNKNLLKVQFDQLSNYFLILK